MSVGVKKIRVGIADDSTFMRKQLKRLVESSGKIEIVAFATNGREAIELVKTHQPDVLLLDIEMPIMSGLVTLTYLMKHHPLPIIVVSAYATERGNYAMLALEQGALDVIEKPSGPISLNIAEIKKELVQKIIEVSQADVQKIDHVWEQKTKPIQPIDLEDIPLPTAIVIGASTGGTIALETVLPQFPKDYPCSIFVIQHLPRGFTSLLANQLDELCPMEVCEAMQGQKIKPGVIYIAPGGRHMELKGHKNNIFISISKISEHPKEDYIPSINITMASVAMTYEHRVVGVIMTGMGDDGTRGLKAIHSAGGICIAEDQTSALIDGMPNAARQSGFVDHIYALFDIAVGIGICVKKLNFYKNNTKRDLAS
jgi:two-component system, chemotaxis family, protein-glutamate methylesterase/glutaminase